MERAAILFHHSLPARRTFQQPAKAVRLVGVGRERPVGSEIQVPLDRQAQLAAHALQFGEPDASQLGEPHAEITETESDIRFFRIEFGQQPGAGTVRGEELNEACAAERNMPTTGKQSLSIPAALLLAIGQQQRPLISGKQ